MKPINRITPNTVSIQITTPYSFLSNPYSLLHTPYSLLHTPYSLLLTPFSLLHTPYSLLPTHHSLTPQLKTHNSKKYVPKTPLRYRRIHLRPNCFFTGIPDNSNPYKAKDARPYFLQAKPRWKRCKAFPYGKIPDDESKPWRKHNFG